MMSTVELLNVEPVELKFPFELKKQISSSLQLLNKTDNHVAFKIKTTNPKKYSVRPNTSVVLPQSTCDIVVTMQAQKEAPVDMQCKDKFLLQSVIAPQGSTTKDITPKLFSKEAGHVVEEYKLRVVYVSPPQPFAPVPEGSEEGCSPRGSVSENGHFSASDSGVTGSLVAKLTDEKNAAIQQNNRIRQELELLKREASKGQGGVSFMITVLVGLIGVILGYIMKA